MYFTKFFSNVKKEYIYKIIICEKRMRALKQIINEDMSNIKYDDLNVKRFNIEEEKKFKKSKNYIGDNIINEIQKSEEKYYTVELAQEQFENIFIQNLEFLIFYKTKFEDCLANFMETRETMKLIQKDYRKITEDIINDKI